MAGVLAGALATAVEIVLWWLGGFALPDTLLRDARFAAAIVLGSRVLVRAAMPDWQVLLAATLVHVALSIVYAIALAMAIARMRNVAAVAAGAAFGLLLYALNMYGFTAVFPWFAATRDWITTAAHVVFGATAAALYKAAAGHAQDAR